MMRSSTQLLSTLAEDIYTYLKPAESIAEDKEYKKPSRHRIPFAKNYTASLALPGRMIKVKKLKEAKKPAKSKKKATASAPEIKAAIKEEKRETKAAPLSSTASLFSYLSSLVPTCTKPSEPLFIMLERKEECKPIIESQDPVFDEMKTLESELKQLENQKELKETYKKIQESTKKLKTDEAKTLKAEIDELAEKIDVITLKKVELVADKIQEHARRRVDLFFYLLLAVRGKHLVISKATTLKQHGVGATDVGTHACHSSLFPQLKFTPLPSDSIWSRFFAGAPFTLKNTHFAETLNMTMELPKVVNEFDCQLESVPLSKTFFVPTRYIKDCLAILNDVSQSKLDIPEAMQQFFITLNDFFDNFLVVTKTDEKIWEYQKAGTFMAANRDLTLKNSYLHTMLRLDQRPPAEAKEDMYQSTLTKLGLYQHPTSEVEKVLRNPEALTEFYQRMQNEILNSKIQPIEKRKRQATKAAKLKTPQQEEKKPIVATRKSARTHHHKM